MKMKDEIKLPLKFYDIGSDDWVIDDADGKRLCGDPDIKKGKAIFEALTSHDRLEAANKAMERALRLCMVKARQMQDESPMAFGVEDDPKGDIGFIEETAHQAITKHSTDTDKTKDLKHKGD